MNVRRGITFLGAAVVMLICGAGPVMAQQHGDAAPPASSTQSPHDAHGQHMMPPMGMSMTGPLDIGQAREGSGTSWLPDVSPMYAVHLNAGVWNVMIHGN